MIVRILVVWYSFINLVASSCTKHSHKVMRSTSRLRVRVSALFSLSNLLARRSERRLPRMSDGNSHQSQKVRPLRKFAKKIVSDATLLTNSRGHTSMVVTNQREVPLERGGQPGIWRIGGGRNPSANQKAASKSHVLMRKAFAEQLVFSANCVLQTTSENFTCEGSTGQNQSYHVALPVRTSLLTSNHPFLTLDRRQGPTCLTQHPKHNNHKYISIYHTTMVVTGPLHEPFLYSSDDEASFCVNETAKEPLPKSTDRVNSASRKAVHFETEVKVEMIPSRRHYSKEELESMYMTEYDKLQVKQDIRRLLRQMREQESTLDSKAPATTLTATTPLTKDTTTASSSSATATSMPEDATKPQEEMRGLECFLPGNLLVRRQTTRSAIRRVIDQQKDGGVVSEEWVKHVYLEVTAPSVWAARIRGLTDQQLHKAGPPPFQMMIR